MKRAHEVSSLDFHLTLVSHPTMRKKITYWDGCYYGLNIQLVTIREEKPKM